MFLLLFIEWQFNSLPQIFVEHMHRMELGAGDIEMNKTFALLPNGSQSGEETSTQAVN